MISGASISEWREVKGLTVLEPGSLHFKYSVLFLNKEKFKFIFMENWARRSLETSRPEREKQARILLDDLFSLQIKLDILRTEAAKTSPGGYQTDKPMIERVDREMLKIIEQIQKGGPSFQQEVFRQVDERMNELAERTLRFAAEESANENLAGAEAGATKTGFDFEQNERQLQRVEAVKDFLAKHLGIPEGPYFLSRN